MQLLHQSVSRQRLSFFLIIELKTTDMFLDLFVHQLQVFYFSVELV